MRFVGTSAGASTTTKQSSSTTSGYQSIFGVINAALRVEELERQQELIVCAAFLVELINIDLYHFRAARSEFDGFEGEVLRGMLVPRSQLEQMLSVMQRRPEERYMAVPSAMMSATTDRTTAMSFASEAPEADTRCAVLWKIHVASIDSNLLQMYRKKYPLSVVTSISAVPIHELSAFPHDKKYCCAAPSSDRPYVYLRKGRRPTGDGL